MRRSFAIIGTFLFFAQALLAQTTPEFSAYFRQGESHYDLSYHDNGTQIASFLKQVKEINDSQYGLVFSINIRTSCSPDGSTEANTWMANERTKAVRDYVVTKSGLNPSQVRVVSTGVDWDRMKRLVDSTDCAWKDAVLTAIQRNESYIGDVDAYRSALLKEIDEGRCWEWLKDNIFSHMRVTTGFAKVVDINSLTVARSKTSKDTLVMIHRYEGGANGGSSDTIVVSRRDTVYYVKRVAKGRKAKEHYFKRDDEFLVPLVGMRTNLLLPLMNAGLEVPLGNRFSVGADVYFPWLPRPLADRMFPKNTFCAQVFAASIEGRIWLGRNHENIPTYDRYRLRGHSLGVTLGGSYYDIQYEKKGNQGEAYVFGVGYKYSLPLGKADVHLEFELGAGIIYNVMHPYTLQENNLLIRDKDEMHVTIRNVEHIYWGYPIKAGINLVVPIPEIKRTGKARK